MARRNANCPPSETARLRLEAIARGPLADRLRASLHRRHPHCSVDEIAEASQEAYLRALRACPVEDEAAIYAWLRRTMDNLLMDRMRLLSHEAPVSDTAGVFVRASDTSADPERELERTEQRRELVALFELVSQQLAPRQRAVLGLYVRGVSVGSGRRPCRLALVVSPQPEVAARRQAVGDRPATPPGARDPSLGAKVAVLSPGVGASTPEWGTV